MENLDLKCAGLGRELAELRVKGKAVEEKVFTSALGVLEEQGPYACFLYLQAREDEAGKEIAKRGAQFLGEVLKLHTAGDTPLESVQALARNLDDLLFARDLLRQAFVYARYHAKARSEVVGS